MNMETGGFGGDDRRRFLVPALIVAAAVIVLLLILGISAVVRSRTAAAVPATATVVRTATRPPVVATPATRTPAPSAPTVPGAIPTPRPSGAPNPAPSAAPAGARAFLIANTGGDNINMRLTPSTTGEIVARLAQGDEVTEIGPPKNAEGRDWLNVRTADGLQGWIAAEFAAPK